MWVVFVCTLISDPKVEDRAGTSRRNANKHSAQVAKYWTYPRLACLKTEKSILMWTQELQGAFIFLQKTCTPINTSDKTRFKSPQNSVLVKKGRRVYKTNECIFKPVRLSLVSLVS